MEGHISCWEDSIRKNVLSPQINYSFNKILINILIGVFQNLKRIQSSAGKMNGQESFIVK